MLLAAAMVVSMSLEPPVTEFTTEQMCIFASNRMLFMEARYPDKYKKSPIEMLLNGDENVSD
jgi:hypothetical protein